MINIKSFFNYVDGVSTIQSVRFERKELGEMSIGVSGAPYVVEDVIFSDCTSHFPMHFDGHGLVANVTIDNCKFLRFHLKSGVRFRNLTISGRRKSGEFTVAGIYEPQSENDYSVDVSDFFGDVSIRGIPLKSIVGNSGFIGLSREDLPSLPEGPLGDFFSVVRTRLKMYGTIYLNVPKDRASLEICEALIEQGLLHYPFETDQLFDGQ